MTSLLDTVSYDNLHAASRAFNAARDERLPISDYDAWRIEHFKTPVSEVRAEAERKAKLRKAAEARQACERKVIRRTVQTLIKAGCAVSLYDGQEMAIHRSNSVNAIMAEVHACDEEWLYVYAWDDVDYEDGKGEWKRVGTIYLVYGNSGPEVIADYSTSLEEMLAPVFAYCDKLEA